MHTEPKDPHGQDLVQIVDHLGMKDGQVLFSTNKLPLEQIPTFYNMADVTINISDAEGFGLATLESLSCGVPIIATVTGGLQEQVIGPEGENGIPLYPSSKSIIDLNRFPISMKTEFQRRLFLPLLIKCILAEKSIEKNLVIEVDVMFCKIIILKILILNGLS